MINITGNEPVKTMQTCLRALHYDTAGEIPAVIPNGIYGPETTDAVLAFQKREGLPMTGKIDYETWTRIYGAYQAVREKQNPPKPLYHFPTYPDYTLTKGENSDIVAIVQFVLRALSDGYCCIKGLPPSGVYDDATEEDVRSFQKLVGLPTTGTVDRMTWDRLADSYNRIQTIHQ